MQAPRKLTKCPFPKSAPVFSKSSFSTETFLRRRSRRRHLLTTRLLGSYSSRFRFWAPSLIFRGYSDQVWILFLFVMSGT
ncbi:hypothetical protein Pfo_022260 [Paulownia fortunei]|nr:hypothetical protein Pfo_022260 [Paulownia fortunei]